MGCETATKLCEISLQAFIEVKNAFDDCDPDIQAVVTEMLEVYKDKSTSPDEKQMAVHTILDALFPSLSVDLFCSERKLAKSSEGVARDAELDAEEQYFSERLRKFMDEKGISQEKLAVQMGVGQPAVSNMLNRQCRPQQRTIDRAAEALGIPSDELWPTKKLAVE